MGTKETFGKNAKDKTKQAGLMAARRFSKRTFFILYALSLSSVIIFVGYVYCGSSDGGARCSARSRLIYADSGCRFTGRRRFTRNMKEDWALSKYKIPILCGRF